MAIGKRLAKALSKALSKELSEALSKSDTSEVMKVLEEQEALSAELLMVQ